MATYYVDSAAAGLNNGTSWTDAWTSPNSLPSLASGDIVYVSSTSVDAFAYGGTKTWTGPTASPPARIISVTSGTTTYAASTTNQFGNAAQVFVFDGAFELYGIVVASTSTSGSCITFGHDSNESIYAEDCTFKVGPNGGISSAGDGSKTVLINCAINCAADAATPRSGTVVTTDGRGELTMIGGSFASVTQRTGVVFANGVLFISGVDMSGFTNATTCEWTDTNGRRRQFVNCKSAATWVLNSTSAQATSVITAINCGDSSDDPTFLIDSGYFGMSYSTTTNYRSSGASVEGTAVGWRIRTDYITTTGTSEGSPYYTPWIYGVCTTTGSKTFAIHMTHDTQPGTDGNWEDDEVWLEVEYMGTSGSPKYSLVSTQRATPTTTPTAYPTDGTSTWNGAGPAFTYKQKMTTASVTVENAGLFRARVAVGVANIVAADYFIIDPLIVVA